MPGGIHYLLGLLLIQLFSTVTGTTISSKPPVEKEEMMDYNYKWLKIGLVFGSVLPDIDVLVAIIAIIVCYMLGGKTDDFVEIAEFVHRSATHTLLLWVPLLLLFCFLLCTVSTNTGKLRKISSKFILGVSMGAIVHVLADTVYLKGVKMFWPWTNEVFFYEIPQLYLYHIYYYSVYTQKIFFVIDHCSEVIFYAMLILYTDMKRTTLFKLKCLCYAQLMANFVCFLIDRFIDLEFHNFVILLYFPGFFFLAISIILPLIITEPIASFEWARI
jgi:membrane-bound metal-dependent hydrolase YbcI (DUF457 family)